MDKFIIFGAVIITLIFSPINFDGLVIPKMFILFIGILYSIPILIGELKDIKVSKKTYIIIISIPLLILTNLILIVVMSDAPMEQQLFGRTGRGFGLLVYFSFLVLTLNSIVFIKFERISLLSRAVVVSALGSATYAFMQRFNLDVFDWNSQTNGVIGTLGNPNFQSSLTASAFIPAIVISYYHRYRYLTAPLIILFFLGSIYISQSTQGYIGIAGATLVFILTRVWYLSKRLFFSSAFISLAIGAYITLGMLNYGFFAKFLYKISVQSRGDFWRSAWATGIDNPVFGVGLDSFKDSYFLYRDQIAANHPFAESADNAHNYFLEFLATGGFPLALAYLFFVSYVFYSFVNVLRKQGHFNPQLAAIFSAWCVLQAQSIISPGNIVLYTWNFILSGAVIGFNILKIDAPVVKKIKKSNSGIRLSSISLIMIGVFIVYPIHRTDRVLLNGLNSQSGDLIIKSTELYPRSESRYNLVGIELLRSNLFPQALELARSATKWNPNAVSGWGLIVANPTAPITERENARLQILRLDPFNRAAKDLKF